MSLENEGAVAAPVVEAPVTETPVTPEAPKASMEDTIRAKFRELSKSDEELTKPEGKVDKPAEPIRGPDGKFQKTGDLAAAVVEPPVVEGPAVDPTLEPAAKTPEELAAKAAAEEAAKAAVDPALAKAPSSWKKEAQAKWAAMDPDLQREVLRREEDFHKGLETYKGWANVGQTLHAEIQPYEAMIRAANTTPQALIKDVFNTIYQLKTGSADQKAAVALNILQGYGVDLEAVTAAAARAAEGQPAVDPRVALLEQKLSKFEQDQKAREQENLRRDFADVVSETEAFSKAPNHEHYEAVKLEMAAFLESGVCSTLQEAYDKACWANDTVRAKLDAKRREAERKQVAEKAAAAKKAAAVNVVSRGTLPTAPKVGTMDETIRNKLREISARA